MFLGVVYRYVSNPELSPHCNPGMLSHLAFAVNPPLVSLFLQFLLLVNVLFLNKPPYGKAGSRATTRLDSSQAAQGLPQLRSRNTERV